MRRNYRCEEVVVRFGQETICGSTKIRHTKRLGPARPTGSKSSNGKNKLTPCTGPAKRYCRVHNPAFSK